MQNRQYVVLYGFYQNGGMTVTATRGQDLPDCRQSVMVTICRRTDAVIGRVAFFVDAKKERLVLSESASRREAAEDRGTLPVIGQRRSSAYLIQDMRSHLR